MGLFNQGKTANNRRFSYEPRFYNPERDDRIKRKIRVKRLVRKRRDPLGLIIFGILFAMVVYIYMNVG